MKLKQLEKRHADLLAKGRAAYKAAEDEGREFSESEWAELKGLDIEVAELNVEIQKGQADAALAAWRQTYPDAAAKEDARKTQFATEDEARRQERVRNSFVARDLD